MDGKHLDEDKWKENTTCRAVTSGAMKSERTVSLHCLKSSDNVALKLVVDIDTVASCNLRGYNYSGCFYSHLLLTVKHVHWNTKDSIGIGRNPVLRHHREQSWPRHRPSKVLWRKKVPTTRPNWRVDCIAWKVFLEERSIKARGAFVDHKILLDRQAHKPAHVRAKLTVLSGESSLA